jgi:ATP-dependent protease ClpP protease subunit
MSIFQKTVSLQRECYTMQKANGAAEITMYGQIVRKRPVDWLTGKPKEGNYIILDEFLEDLKELKSAKELTIRLDSLGGDAYASLTIHNKLREMKARKTIRVDGVAMSGGAMILCAACGPKDTVQINPSSLVMIHRCITPLMGYYNADELDSLSESSKAMDRSQAAIYKAKSGLEEEELLDMMTKTTTLTGEEAMEKGFADELIEGAEPVELAASADRKTLYIRGQPFSMDGPTLPDSLPVIPDAEAPDDIKQPEIKEPEAENGKGGIMSKTLEELRTENPELAEALLAEAKALAGAETEAQVAAAVQAERKRLQEIDEISALYSEEDLHNAKYGTPCTAKEMAFEAAKKAAQKGKTFLDELNKDTQASGADKISAAPAPDDKTELSPEERRAAGKADAQALKKE